MTPGSNASGDSWLEVDDGVAGNRWYDTDGFLAARLQTDCEPDPLPTCGQLSAEQGYVRGACESNGNGACGGQGPASSDCDHCCDTCDAGITCGDLAQEQGWTAASCESNGNGACGGSGTATCDCEACCDAG